MSNPLFQIQNPFNTNPNFSTPEDNFIERGISNGIEKGVGKVGDKILNAGSVKAENFAHNLPEIASLALISYLIYLGYKSFVKKDAQIELEKIYPAFMIYIIFKLFWKVVLKI